MAQFSQIECTGPWLFKLTRQKFSLLIWNFHYWILINNGEENADQEFFRNFGFHRWKFEPHPGALFVQSCKCLQWNSVLQTRIIDGRCGLQYSQRFASLFNTADLTCRCLFVNSLISNGHFWHFYPSLFFLVEHRIAHQKFDFFEELTVIGLRNLLILIKI